jgi:hypothetical protein
MIALRQSLNKFSKLCMIQGTKIVFFQPATFFTCFLSLILKLLKTSQMYLIGREKRKKSFSTI